MSMYQPVNRAEFKNASAILEGDTRNEIVVRLKDKNNAAIDLTGRTVKWSAANENGKLVDNRTATIYAGGEVGIKFLSTDSFGDGIVYLQFMVDWGSGQIERFPADNNLFMKVPRSHDNVRFTPLPYVSLQQINTELNAKFDAYAAAVQQGAKGEDGEDGAGLVIKGTLTNSSQLPSSGNVDGEGFLINGDLWVYSDGSWINVGRIQGPPGETGATGATGNTGPAGNDGKDLQFNWSGYTLGVRKVGDTSYIYSTSLRGATGETGNQGIQGIQGNPGPTGITGATGSQGPQGIQGITGNTGATGPTGKNLEYSWNGYQLGVRQQGETSYVYQNLRGATGATGLTGNQGIQGERGEKGDVGAGLNILGSFSNSSELPATGSLGDGYLINGALYVWDGSAWDNVGNIQGPAGVAGPIGETGPAGKNLEFLWNGYTLGVRQQGAASYTYSQSLRGATGATGNQGIQGIEGNTGPTGNTGAAGSDGKNIEFLWNGTQLGIRQQGQANYVYMDLKGATGNTGATGNQGIQGSTGAPGADGKSLEYNWTGTSLGVRQTGGAYVYVDLKGATGNTGATGNQGIQGIQGIAGVAGKDLEFNWSGYTLGVRKVGDATYTYSTSLRGATGATGSQGIQGIPGVKGDTGNQGNQGIQGPAGTNATLNIELRTSDPASPANGQVWLRTDL